MMKARQHKDMGDPRSAMDLKPSYRGRAFTSDLTGQEFWLVIAKGYVGSGPNMPPTGMGRVTIPAG